MLDLPPVFAGREVADDPVEAAIAAAAQGCDAGLVVHRLSDAELDAALVLAPEVPLGEAAAMLLVAGNGFADAFGALAPPELALHLEWPGRFRLEGARCGGLSAAAPACGVDAVPGWLVIGLRVALATGGGEPGERPDQTDLRSEGVHLSAADLLGAWMRHTLSWIARWEDEGMAPVHRDWLGRAWGRDREIRVATASGPVAGTVQGLDERGGLLLKAGRGVALVPLTEMLERRRC